MQQAALWIGPALCALAVLAGAFGAHGLKARLSADSLALWETAARYLIYGGFGLTLVGLVARQWPRAGFAWAALGLLFGAAIFCGTVAALALGAPRWLGAVTPIGGLLLILGFVLFAWTAFRLV
jgi:uncharacterized membrane protein YgdD (TMEM256/DUF423 family)